MLQTSDFGWTDGWKDVQTDHCGWTDGWRDVQTIHCRMSAEHHPTLCIIIK